MKFISNAGSGDNRFSTYTLTIVIVVLAYAVIGQLPLFIDLLLTATDLSSFKHENVSALANHFGNNKFLFYLLIPFLTSLISLLIAVKYLHKRELKSVITSRERFDYKRFLFSFFLWGIILAVFLMISINSNPEIIWNFKPDKFFTLFAISLFMITIQTSFEEIFLRGYILQGVYHRTKKVWISILFSSILFGLLHIANPEIKVLGYSILIYYIGTGLFLAIIAFKDNGLELSMGYHAINNIFAAVFLTNDWQAFQTDALFKDHSAPVFGLENILTLVILQPLLLFLFSMVYKWEWKK